MTTISLFASGVSRVRTGIVLDTRLVRSLFSIGIMLQLLQLLCVRHKVTSVAGLLYPLHQAYYRHTKLHILHREPASR